jgi:uncharacterized protein (TIGR02444 family)
MSDPAAEFWRFALAIYGRPGVAPACIVLQDQYDRDVNVMLFGCWLGVSGRGELTRAQLDAADRAVTPWRKTVVENFRAARRAIKASDEPDKDAIYAKAKAIELEAEKFLQGRLVAMAPAPTIVGVPERLAAALANLALYIGDAPAEPIVTALGAMAAEGFAA